jgi:hypothetical protein
MCVVSVCVCMCVCVDDCLIDYQSNRAGWNLEFGNYLRSMLALANSGKSPSSRSTTKYLWCLQYFKISCFHSSTCFSLVSLTGCNLQMHNERRVDRVGWVSEWMIIIIFQKVMHCILFKNLINPKKNSSTLEITSVELQSRVPRRSRFTKTEEEKRITRRHTLPPLLHILMLLENQVCMCVCVSLSLSPSRTRALCACMCVWMCACLVDILGLIERGEQVQ